MCGIPDWMVRHLCSYSRELRENLIIGTVVPRCRPLRWTMQPEVRARLACRRPLPSPTTHQQSCTSPLCATASRGSTSLIIVSGAKLRITSTSLSIGARTASSRGEVRCFWLAVSTHAQLVASRFGTPRSSALWRPVYTLKPEPAVTMSTSPDYSLTIP